MIMQIKTEKELIDMVHALKKEIDKLTTTNKTNAKKFKLMQAEIDKKPETQIIKEVTIKEVKPVVNNVTTGLDDNQVLELINKHVTMNYVNKLYKKGK